MIEEELDAALASLKRPESDIIKWGKEARWHIPNYRSRCPNIPENSVEAKKVILRAFRVNKAGYELIICKHLGVPTEDRRIIDARKWNARYRWIFIGIGVVSIIISWAAIKDKKENSPLTTQSSNTADQVTKDADTLSSGGKPASEQKRDVDGGQDDTDEDQQAGQTDKPDQPGEE